MRLIKLFLFFSFLFAQAAIAAGQGKNQTKIEGTAQTQVKPVVTFHVAAPVLVWPVNQEVDITDKETLTFKWNSADVPFEVYGYLFKIYRGTDISPKGEIYKEQVSGLDSLVDVPAGRFEDGQTYTWSIKQINNGPQLIFSDPAYATFKIIKKPKGGRIVLEPGTDNLSENKEKKDENEPEF